jgi:hypothetical protein
MGPRPPDTRNPGPARRPRLLRRLRRHTAPGHVGIVTGHDIMIDAPYTGQVIRQESFSDSTDLVGFTRP